MCKVEELIAKYDLDAPTNSHASMETYLEERWTGTDGQPAVGVSALTEAFNKQILKERYKNHNRNTYLVESEYPLITSTEESVQRSELAADLREDDLNIKHLKIHTVAETTMGKHLRECTSVTKETENWTQPETPTRERSIHWAEYHAEHKTKNTLRKLTEEGQLAQGTDAIISVNIDLVCPECGKQVPVRDAIERGYVCPDHMLTEEDAETLSLNTSPPENPSTPSTKNEDSSTSQDLTESEPPK